MPVNNIFNSDVFLVSYPRSGNTWVRNIIAEIIFGRSGKTLGEIGNYVPDVHAANVDDMNLPHPRVIKSHFNYTENYKRVIHIVRDPRDVFISYHKYLKQRNRYDNSLENFVVDVCNGSIFPGTWSHHINSWVFNEDRINSIDNNNFLMVKYENLTDEPEKNIIKIATFLGKKLHKSRLDEIKHRTTISAMKTKERKGSFEWLPGGLEFINDGIYGKWKNTLPETLVDYINKNNEKVMVKLNYL